MASAFQRPCRPAATLPLSGTATAKIPSENGRIARTMARCIGANDSSAQRPVLDARHMIVEYPRRRWARQENFAEHTRGSALGAGVAA